MDKDIKKPTDWLLKKIPADIVKIVRDHQVTEMKNCNCRYGVGKTIFDLLRKAYGAEKN